jgi:hypothetical protein
MHYGLYTGSIKSEAQIIIGRHKDVLLTILFDLQGALTEVIERPYVPAPIEQKLSLRESLEEEPDYEKPIRKWADELYVTLGTIHINEFFLPDHLIGIKELDEESIAFFEDETAFPENEREGLREMVVEWRQDGRFVFWWLNDFWCDRFGMIQDS